MPSSRTPTASRRAKSNRSKKVFSDRTLSGLGEKGGLSGPVHTQFVQNDKAITKCQLSSPVRSSKARSKPLMGLATRSANSPAAARTARHTVRELEDDTIRKASRSKSTRMGPAPPSSIPRRSPRNSKALSESSRGLSTSIPPVATFPQEAYVDFPDGAQARTSESPQQHCGPFAMANMLVHCSNPYGQPLPATWCRALLDTQSDGNLISWQKYTDLRKRGFIDPGTPVSEIVRTLGLERIIPTGAVFVKWHMSRHPDTQYNEKFLILPEDLDPGFDFLIGKKCIEKNKFLIHNPRTMYLKCYQEMARKNSS